MKFKAKAAIVAAMTAVVMGVGVGQAEAIRRVSCGTNLNYLWLWSNATTCWVEAGHAVVVLYNVNLLTSGNNAGEVDGFFQNSGTFTGWWYQKYERHDFPAPVKIVNIEIW
jgi:hypothetical protein